MSCDGPRVPVAPMSRGPHHFGDARCDGPVFCGRAVQSMMPPTGPGSRDEIGDVGPVHVLMIAVSHGHAA